MMITLTALLMMALTTRAMSYEQARDQALFLTDKMAYELNLTEDQYEAAYEINLDYLMSINNYDELYGTYWERRNLDLSYVLLDWQYRAYLDATYFYRPLYWDAGYWHFAVYARYPYRTWFYFGRPAFYFSYHGGHSWHHNGGHSWYHGRRFGHDHHIAKGSHGHGMRNGYDRGDYNKQRGNYERTRDGKGLERRPDNGRRGDIQHGNRDNGGRRGDIRRGGRDNGSVGSRHDGLQRENNGRFGGRRDGNGSYRDNGSRPSSTRSTVGGNDRRPEGNSSRPSVGNGSRHSGVQRGDVSAPTRTFTPSRSGNAGPQRSSTPSRSYSAPSQRGSSSQRSYSAPSRSGASMGGSSRSGGSFGGHSGGAHMGGGSRSGGSFGGHSGGGHSGGGRGGFGGRR